MRSRVLVLLLVLVGCEDLVGTYFVIEPPSDPEVQTHEIWVYVGVGPSVSGPLAPPGFSPESAVDGPTWIGDVGSPFVFDLSQVSRAELRFLPGSAAHHDLVTVIGVGFRTSRRADGSVVREPTSKTAVFDVRVRDDVLAVWPLRLERAGPASAESHDAQQVLVWGPPSDDTSCVHVVDTDALEPQPRSASIVRADDRDCDGLDAGHTTECDDNWFGAVQDVEHVECLTTKNVRPPGSSTAVGVCVLGGDACEDGVDQRACNTDKPYCLPDSVCARCPSSDTYAAFANCAIQPPVNSVGRLQLVCPVFVMQTAVGHDVCTQRLASPAGFIRPMLGDGICIPGPVYFHGSSPADGWTEAPTIAGAAATLDPTTEECAFEIDVTRGPMTGDLDQLIGGLLRFELKNQRGLAVPVVFTVRVEDCEDISLVHACSELVADPGLASCIDGTFDP